MTSFKHYNDITDQRAARVQLTCGCSFFYLSHWLVRVCEIELSHTSNNNRNPDLVCENTASLTQYNLLHIVIFQSKLNLQALMNPSFVYKWILSSEWPMVWASTRENLSSVVCEQQRRRPACTSAQSDQRLCYSLFGKYHI